MKNLTRIVLVALAAIGLVLTVAVLSPRRTRASAPMTVDPTSPRTPWSGSCSLIPSSATPAAASCIITNVPTNAELVIESEVFNAQTPEPDTIESFSVNSTEAGVGTEVWYGSTASTPSLVDGLYVIRLTTAIPFYADPGTNIQCGAIAPHHAAFTVPPAITLTGYYVSPPVS